MTIATIRAFVLGVAVGALGLSMADVPNVPVKPSGAVLVDINSMLDVGFVLTDPEGYEVSHFAD